MIQITGRIIKKEKLKNQQDNTIHRIENNNKFKEHIYNEVI